MSSNADSFWDRLPLGDRVTVLERLPCGLAALSKPSGTLSHPNEAGQEDRSLIKANYSLEQECYEWSPAEEPTMPQKLWLLNRLDSGTSGVILVADNPMLAEAIKVQFRSKRIRKIYNALVFGLPSVPLQLWRDRLAIEKREGQVRARGAGSIPCECQMRLVHRTRGQPLLSLLQLEPHTGRSHQLRVQCAMRKLPIVGDATYGDFASNRRFAKECGLKRLFLHALVTSFDFEFEGKTLHFHAKAPLPVEFRTVLKV